MYETDIELWKQMAGQDNNRWDDRSSLFSRFIRPHDAVLDLGAGDHKLKNYLPSSCTYIPVDCVNTREGTFVVDFNSEFRLPEVNFNVIVCAGFLEYLNNLDLFMKNLSTENDGKFIIFSYSVTPENRKHITKVVTMRQGKRRRFNELGARQECINFFSRHVSDLTPIAYLDREWIFTGVVSKSGDSNFEDKISINDIIFRKTKIRNFIFNKVEKAASKFT